VFCREFADPCDEFGELPDCCDCIRDIALFEISFDLTQTMSDKEFLFRRFSFVGKDVHRRTESFDDRINRIHFLDLSFAIDSDSDAVDILEFEVLR